MYKGSQRAHILIESKSSSACYCCSVAKLCLTLCDPVDCSTPGFPVPSPAPTACSNSCHELVMPSNRFILCHPLLLLPSIFSSIRVFYRSWLLVSGGQSIGASASASVLPMNFQDGLIFFRIDWLNLLGIQGTLESLPSPRFCMYFQVKALHILQNTPTYILLALTCDINHHLV